MPLLELTELAETVDLIGVSYADDPWLWRELLRCDSQTDQRRLRLIALQPRAADIAAPFLQAGTRIR